MKSRHIFLLVSLVGLFLISGCKKDFPAIGDYPSKTEALQGTWKAEKVMQLDYVAQEKGENLFQWNVTAAYNLTDFTVQFNADGTFVISGTAHNFAKIARVHGHSMTLLSLLKSTSLTALLLMPLL